MDLIVEQLKIVKLNEDDIEYFAEKLAINYEMSKENVLYLQAKDYL